jgi:rhomboid family GlyGly-CTERM serine protease
MRAPSKNFPLATWLLAGMAILVGCCKVAQGLLIYDRAAILQGDLWRLATGPLVHFSTGHLLCDLVAFAVAGFLAETASPGKFGGFLLMTSLVTGMGLLVVFPNVQRCAGLSGIAVAAAIYAALVGWQRSVSFPWQALALAVAVIAKISAEAINGNLLLAGDNSGALHNGLIAHSFGFVCGVVGFLLRRDNGKDCLDTIQSFPENVG